VEENITTNQVLKNVDFLEKLLIAQQEKTTANAGYVEKWVIMLMSVKNKKNNKLIETLGSLDYVELSEDEALDLAVGNNKEIVEIIEDDEYEENDYEETSHMMESSAVSLGDLQGEEFVVDNNHEEVKGDWVLPIIQKDMIYKNLFFN